MTILPAFSTVLAARASQRRYAQNQLDNSTRASGGTDERTVAQVTQFYENRLNVPILISHALDIIAMRSGGETAEKLEQLTDMYRMTDGTHSH
jgi:hypothetical protein